MIRIELSFSTVPKARRRLLRSEFCGHCAKLLLRDQADARSYIGLILRHPILYPGAFALHPYPCPMQKGWHAGRDPKALSLDFKAGRAVLATEGAHAG